MDVDGFRLWLLNEERSPNTVRAYVSAVRKFENDYGEISKENALAYKRRLIRDASPRTAAAAVTALNAYCRFAGLPECRVKSVRIFKELTVENVISEAELEQLKTGLLNAGNLKGYWTVRMLAETGARVSELVRMDKRALSSGTWSGWTKGKIRTIRIPDTIRKEAAGYFDSVPGPLLFPNYLGKEMTPRGCAKNIERWCSRYGIRPEAAHPHGLRHRFALDFLKWSGGNIALLKDLLGHESIETTAVYLRLSEEEAAAEFNRIMEMRGAAEPIRAVRSS